MKVLVIEDNPDNMMLICDLLELSGYSVERAESGMQGYKMAQTIQPDYIILDIQLPDIHGYEVLKEIKRDEATREIPIVAMTSFAMAGDREELLKAGCDAYIEKPIDPETVISQIKALLTKRGL